MASCSAPRVITSSPVRRCRLASPFRFPAVHHAHPALRDGVMFGESVVGKVARRKALFTNRFDLPDGDESIHPAPTVRPNDAAQYSRGHVDVNRNAPGGDDIVSAIFCDYLTPRNRRLTCIPRVMQAVSVACASNEALSIVPIFGRGELIARKRRQSRGDYGMEKTGKGASRAEDCNSERFACLSDTLLCGTGILQTTSVSTAWIHCAAHGSGTMPTWSQARRGG